MLGGMIAAVITRGRPSPPHEGQGQRSTPPSGYHTRSGEAPLPGQPDTLGRHGLHRRGDRIRWVTTLVHDTAGATSDRTGSAGEEPQEAPRATNQLVGVKLSSAAP